MTRTLLAAASAVAPLALGACGDNAGAPGSQSPRAASGRPAPRPSSRSRPGLPRIPPAPRAGAAPRNESLGTGGGIQAFCQGVGPSTPDIANASPR